MFASATLTDRVTDLAGEMGDRDSTQKVRASERHPDCVSGCGKIVIDGRDDEVRGPHGCGKTNSVVSTEMVRPREATGGPRERIGKKPTSLGPARGEPDQQGDHLRTRTRAFTVPGISKFIERRLATQ